MLAVSTKKGTKVSMFGVGGAGVGGLTVVGFLFLLLKASSKLKS